MANTWARHKTTKTGLNNGWRLAAVGGGWRLAVGGWWSLGAVLNKKRRFLRTALPEAQWDGMWCAGPFLKERLED